METVNSLLYSIQSLVSNPDKLSNSKDPPPQDPQHHESDLNNYETYSKCTVKTEEDDDLVEEKRRLKEMDAFATDIATRASILRDGVVGLLRAAGNASSDKFDSPSTPVLKEQVARLESELKTTESKLEEMATARNEAATSERRVRRGLYRLAGGRMTIEEVLIAVEKEDNGVSFMETLAMIDGMNNKNVGSPPDGTAAVSSSDAGAMSSPAFSSSIGAAGGSKDSSSPANSEEVAQLKKSLQDIQVIAETRDKKITEVSCPCFI